jgi:hypothetical protein
MQASRGQPLCDRRLTERQTTQLRGRDQSVLVSGDLGNVSVDPLHLRRLWR